MKKIIALLLSVILLMSGAWSLFAAEEAGEGWVFDTLKEKDDGYKPIPLLLIKINYDADGDGKDGYGSGVSPEEMKNKGEQWCHSNDSAWSTMCFSDTGKSLKNYYKDITNGSFWFTPVEETSGNVNDGVITVTIPHRHPQKVTNSNSTEDGASRLAALSAANEFVDFAALDKNGDGKVDMSELAVVYICGGFESSSSSASLRDQFGVHAHYTTGSGLTMDGVSLVRSGFVRVGENVNGEILTVGTLAHELGHFLGAADLYDTDHNKDKKTWNYASDISLMTGGSHNNFSGERRGTSPSYMDPFHLVDLGFVKPVTASDGTYTLYSHTSKEGDYNILKVGTPDPGEYYLIENRFGTSDGRNFDAIPSGSRGIIIWHIDEYAISRGRVNNEGSGHDPGVVPLGVNTGGGSGLSMPYAFFYNPNANERFYSFDSNRYKFPISGTAYTSLTEEQAAEYGLHIDILSPAGHEMEIKITGAKDLTPILGFSSAGSTTSTITFRAVIKDLCGGNVTACGMILSEKANYRDDPNAKWVSLRPDEDGIFTATFEGLAENTKYFCTAYTEGSAGRGERSATGYTKATPVPRDFYYAYLYMAKTEVEKVFQVRLKPGECIPDGPINSMKKAGYLFAGFFTDAEFTEYFNLRSTKQDLEDITLFAKWVEEDLAATIRIHGAESWYKIPFVTEVGSAYPEPIIKPRAGFTFAGWYTDEDLTLPFDFGMVAEDTEPLDLYAKWEKDTATPETTGGTTPPETTGKTDPPATTGGTDTTETTVPAGETTASTTGSDPVEAPVGTSAILFVGIPVLAIVAIGVFIIVKKNQKPKQNEEKGDNQ